MDTRINYLPKHSSFSHPASAANAQGFSIVELLIAVTIGLIILSGVINVVVKSKTNKMQQDEVAFIQDNARFVVETLTSEIRMAGYMGCASPTTSLIANSIDGNFFNFVGTGGIEGYDGQTSVAGFPSPLNTLAKVGSDAFIVRRGDSDELGVESHVAASATISLYKQHSFPPGTPLMIADANCRYVGLFQVSSPNANALPANKIVHNTGAVTSNCTKIIRGSFVCTPSCTAVSCNGYGTTTGSYSPGSKVMRFISRAYFIGPSTVMADMPALKRQSLVMDSTLTTRSEEIAQGVEDMQLLYGVDTNADGDVNQYRTAAQMDVDGSGAIDGKDWDKVKSVRISLVFRSQNPVAPSNQTQVINGVTYNDRYLRQAVNSTVVIRNRM
ncbi:MAG TPA: PilW family protein [Marinagarivorans sp.]|nr:PilW family protein [Marinagarivorans sp.]HNG58927.1 PilW family protein [Cellvibrionaceae bacterium]